MHAREYGAARRLFIAFHELSFNKAFHRFVKFVRRGFNCSGEVNSTRKGKWGGYVCLALAL